MDTRPKNILLVKFQNYFWYVGLALFVTISINLAFGMPYADKMSHWCVLLILVLTILKLITYAEQFRNSGNRTFMILSYLFMLVITVTVYFGIAIL
jgi:hypothetical protein